MQTATVNEGLRGDRLADAITGAIARSPGLARRPDLLMLLEGPPRYAVYPPEFRNELRQKVRACVAENRFAALAAASALAGLSDAVRVALEAVLPAGNEYLIELGHLIARGTASDLADLVEDVSFAGWSAIAIDAGLELDECGEPRDPAGEPVPLPMLARHLIAGLVDDTLRIDPGWLDRYWREQLEWDTARGGDEAAEDDAVPASEPHAPNPGLRCSTPPSLRSAQVLKWRPGPLVNGPSPPAFMRPAGKVRRARCWRTSRPWRRC